MTMSRRCGPRFAAMIAASVATQGVQAEWNSTIAAGGGSVYMTDRTRMRIEGVRRQVWLKGDHSRDRAEPSRSSMTLVGIDCAAMTTATLSWTTYAADGTVTGSQETPDGGSSAGYEPIVPETVIARVAEIACRQEPT